MGEKMSKSDTKWILECRKSEPELELQRLSVSELFSLWRAVVTELKNRVPRTKAAIF